MTVLSVVHPQPPSPGVLLLPENAARPPQCSETPRVLSQRPVQDETCPRGTLTLPFPQRTHHEPVVWARPQAPLPRGQSPGRHLAHPGYGGGTGWLPLTQEKTMELGRCPTLSRGRWAGPPSGQACGAGSQTPLRPPNSRCLFLPESSPCGEEVTSFSLSGILGLWPRTRGRVAPGCRALSPAVT